MWMWRENGFEFYKHVDEVMTNPQAWEGKPLQLHGNVSIGPLPKLSTVRFNNAKTNKNR